MRTFQQSDTHFYLNTNSARQRGGKVSYEMRWAPSRQVMKQFGDDKVILHTIAQSNTSAQLGLDPTDWDSYIRYNDSLQVEIQHNGRVIGIAPSFNLDWWGVQIDRDRSIRCWARY
jgi:hypothetical protein